MLRLGQDYGPNKYSATPMNTPTFNGQYLELTSASSQYLVLPTGLATVFSSSVSSFTSTAWVYLKSVSRSHQAVLSHIYYTHCTAVLYR